MVSVLSLADHKYEDPPHPQILLCNIYSFSIHLLTVQKQFILFSNATYLKAENKHCVAALLNLLSATEHTSSNREK